MTEALGAPAWKAALAGFFVASAGILLAKLAGEISWGLAGGGFAVALLASLAAAWAASRSVASELAPITRAVAALARGERPPRLSEGRKDSFGTLALSVDEAGAARARADRQAIVEMLELRAILDHAAEGIIVLGEEGRVQLINGAARQIFDAPADAAGKLLVEITRNPGVQQFLDGLRARSGRTQIDLELPDPEIRYIRIVGGLVPGTADLPERIVLLVSDVSDLRRLERARIDFVANASHELKTPLASILGYAETLHDDPELDAATRARFQEVILRNARRLQDLVDDLLRLARMESSSTAFHLEQLDLREIVRTVVTLRSSDAATRSVELHCDLPTLPVALTADREALLQCVDNLVGNAIKYTPTGRSVSVSLLADDESAKIVISDTGIGIAPEHLPRIFERFYRADPGRGRETGGTGLGLAIAKHAATLHGGTIEVESELGKGSRFEVILPLART